MAVLSAFSVAACQRAPEPAPSAAARESKVASSRPPLVVAVIFDQLGSDTLLEHSSWLDPRGAIARAVAQGTFFERGVYPYAHTQTAPGHATVFTGAPPAVSGIDGNSAWDEQLEKAIPSTTDARHPVYGRERDGQSAGPARLRAMTVAEALKRDTRGLGKVVSLSLKDRSAIFSVGGGADLALWYDSTLGVFTTSSAWGPGVPGWVSRFQEEHPVSLLPVAWEPLSAAAYREKLGPDDAPGEGNWLGFGTRFPHTLATVASPRQVIRCTPQLSEHLVRLGARAVEAHGLGRDEVPDLLVLGISGTDTAGHVFGPRSWEYVDHLVRADRALGDWLSTLAETTSLSVLITSDHGVAGLLESRADGTGGRLVTRDLANRLEAGLRGTFGAGPHVAGIVGPFVHFHRGARERPDAASLRERALRELNAMPAIAEAWSVAELRQTSASAEPLQRAAALSVAPDNDADIMFLTRRFYTFDIGEAPGKGTNHGSVHDYDRQVPVLLWGAGVPKRREPLPVSQLRVAPTLARLLGVSPPRDAREPSLL